MYLKAMHYDDGEIFFELRCLLDVLYTNTGSNYKMKKCAKATRAILVKDFGNIGIDVDLHLKPSLEAWKTKSPNNTCDDPYIGNEYSLSMVGVVYWLFGCSTDKRGECDHDTAIAVLEGIVSRATNLEAITPSWALEQIGDACRQCDEHVVNERFCKHIGNIVKRYDMEAIREEVGKTWDVVVDVMLALRRSFKKCTASGLSHPHCNLPIMGLLFLNSKVQKVHFFVVRG